jgi:hypothetical protein
MRNRVASDLQVLAQLARELTGRDLVDLGTVPCRDLVTALIAARGPRGAAVFATKLNRMLAAHGAVRPRIIRRGIGA